MGNNGKKWNEKASAVEKNGKKVEQKSHSGGESGTNRNKKNGHFEKKFQRNPNFRGLLRGTTKQCFRIIPTLTLNPIP